MGITAHVKKVCEALKPKQQESIVAYAERLYDTQCHVYDSECPGAPGFPLFCHLDKATKDGWMDTAKKQMERYKK